MNERPIIMTAESVRAILQGSKTQTRRVVKPAARVATIEEIVKKFGYPERHLWEGDLFCPYGEPGDRLWVRETWAQGPTGLIFKADFDTSDGFGSEVVDLPTGKTVPLVWRPSIHIPRALSRLTLEIVGVRVEELQEITEADAKAEGITVANGLTAGYLPKDDVSRIGPNSFVRGFANIWNMINAKRGYSWESNPFVWVIEFKRAGTSPAPTEVEDGS